MGRRKAKEPRKSFRLSVSETAYRTLEALVGDGYHGATVPECATRLLEVSLKAEQSLMNDLGPNRKKAPPGWLDEEEKVGSR